MVPPTNEPSTNFVFFRPHPYLSLCGNSPGCAPRLRHKFALDGPSAPSGCFTGPPTRCPLARSPLSAFPWVFFFLWLFFCFAFFPLHIRSAAFVSLFIRVLIPRSSLLAPSLSPSSHSSYRAPSLHLPPDPPAFLLSSLTPTALLKGEQVVQRCCWETANPHVTLVPLAPAMSAPEATVPTTEAPVAEVAKTEEAVVAPVVEAPKEEAVKPVEEAAAPATEEAAVTEEAKPAEEAKEAAAPVSRGRSQYKVLPALVGLTVTTLPYLPDQSSKKEKRQSAINKFFGLFNKKEKTPKKEIKSDEAAKTEVSGEQ